MLNKETSDKLVALGIDVSKLSEAIKAEDEVSLDVPALFTQEQINAFGKNRFDEGKGAFSEIKAKDFKKQHGIEIDSKDIDEVVNAIIEKNSKIPPDSKLNEYKSQITELQSKLSESLSEKEKLSSEFQNKLFDHSLNNQIVSIMPKNTKLGADDILVLYKNQRSFAKDESGRVLIKKGDDVLKDNLLNPISLQDDFNAFVNEKGLIEKSGMNGDDTGGGGTAKFKSIEDYTAYCDSKGIDPMADENLEMYNSNKE